MAHGRRRYLVAYDIRESKRLRRVHKAMKGFGWAMQYSVFICDLDALELTRLRMTLGDLIHHMDSSLSHLASAPCRVQHALADVAFRRATATDALFVPQGRVREEHVARSD